MSDCHAHKVLYSALLITALGLVGVGEGRGGGSGGRLGSCVLREHHICAHNKLHLLGKRVDKTEGLHCKQHPLLGFTEEPILNCWHGRASLHSCMGRREGRA